MRKLWLWIACGPILLLLIVPIAALVFRGLSASDWENLTRQSVLDALWLSGITTAITVVLIVMLGTPLAYLLARYEFRLKRVVNLLIELPIILPPAVAGLALLLTFGRRGLFGPLLAEYEITLPFTSAAVIIAQVFVAAPFYIRAAAVGFQGVSKEIEDAGRVDGAAGFDLFRTITLPLAAPTLGAGLILSWARALGEFGATILFAGSLQGRTQTMPLLVYNVLERDLNGAILTGLILVGFALIALMISQYLTRAAQTD
ncbi:MAG: ABC transporter permease [Anaerolineae bacterium]|jgi:molybdate transport system permease protein|nr:ABC transporter permease [Anaerolineae bacterium]